MFKKYLSWLFSSKQSNPTPVEQPAEAVVYDDETGIPDVEIPEVVAEAIAEEAVVVKKKRKYYKKKKKTTV